MHIWMDRGRISMMVVYRAGQKNDDDGSRVLKSGREREMKVQRDAPGEKWSGFRSDWLLIITPISELLGTQSLRLSTSICTTTAFPTTTSTNQTAIVLYSYNKDPYPHIEYLIYLHSWVIQTYSYKSAKWKPLRIVTGQMSLTSSKNREKKNFDSI